MYSTGPSSSPTEILTRLLAPCSAEKVLLAVRALSPTPKPANSHGTCCHLATHPDWPQVP